MFHKKCSNMTMEQIGPVTSDDYKIIVTINFKQILQTMHFTKERLRQDTFWQLWCWTICFWTPLFEFWDLDTLHLKCIDLHQKLPSDKKIHIYIWCLWFLGWIIFVFGLVYLVFLMHNVVFGMVPVFFQLLHLFSLYWSIRVFFRIFMSSWVIKRSHHLLA